MHKQTLCSPCFTIEGLVQDEKQIQAFSEIMGYRNWFGAKRYVDICITMIRLEGDKLEEQIEDLFNRRSPFEIFLFYSDHNGVKCGTTILKVSVEKYSMDPMNRTIHQPTYCVVQLKVHSVTA